MPSSSRPRVTMCSSSSADIRGIRTWTSARSTEPCCSIRPSTVSETPTRISVAGTAWSESTLMVSAKVARTSGSPMRSNSSTMTTRTQPRPTVRERALHVGRRDRLGQRLVERALLLARLGAEADHGPLARHLDVGEDAPPQRREVVGALAGDARRDHRLLLGAEPLRQDVGERRLADAGLAEDHDVDAGLADGVDDLLDLLEAAGEDRALADRESPA